MFVTVLYIYIQANCIGARDCVLLLEALQHNPCLLLLDVRANLIELGEEEAGQLLVALAHTSHYTPHQNKNSHNENASKIRSEEFMCGKGMALCRLRLSGNRVEAGAASLIAGEERYQAAHFYPLILLIFHIYCCFL